MKSLKITSLVCGGVLSLAASNVFAQESSSSLSTSPGASSSQQSGSALGTPAGQHSSSYGTGSSTAMHSGSTVRLSQIMNSSVQSNEGKTLGYIRDFTVNPQSGRIEFAVLSLSSAGGASDTATAGRETVPSSRSSNIGTPSAASGSTAQGKLIPVPWQLFSQSWSRQSQTSTSTAATATGGKDLVLNIDESKLRTAPSFDSSDWNQMQTGSLDQRVYSHFGVDRTSALGTPGSAISGQGTSGSSSYPSSSGSSTSPDSSSSDRSSSGTSSGSGSSQADR
jgi:sporulation protein YlmC with PRC-barrel domain